MGSEIGVYNIMNPNGLFFVFFNMDAFGVHKNRKMRYNSIKQASNVFFVYSLMPI